MAIKELLETIRKEIINRLDKRHLSTQARNELVSILSFLSTLEESKKCDGCNNARGCVTCVCGDHWAHFEESEKPMNLDLEIEIEDYVEQRWQFAEDLNAAVPIYLYDMTLNELKDCARHFAKWQKEQDLAEMAQSKSPLSVAYANRCFENGKQAMKEQMLKEAVEGEVMTNGFYPYEPRIVAPYLNCPYNFGDKVRVIVCKKED